MCSSVEMANALGERNLHKAKINIRATSYISFVTIVIEIFALYLLKGPIITVYDSDADVYEIAVVLFEMYLLIIPAEFFQINFMSILKAIGREKIATGLFLFAYYVIGIPIAYYLGVVRGMQSQGIIFGMGAGLYALFFLSSWTLYFTDLPTQLAIITTRVEATRDDLSISFSSGLLFNISEESKT